MSNDEEVRAAVRVGKQGSEHFVIADRHARDTRARVPNPICLAEFWTTAEENTLSLQFIELRPQSTVFADGGSVVVATDMTSDMRKR